MSQAGDPFAQALVELQKSIPQAPTGYRGRLILQFALCGILFVISVLFVVLHCWHARRQQREIWFVRLQKSTSISSSGRHIVFNSIPLVAFFAALAAVGQAGTRYKEWSANIEHKSEMNSTIAAFTPWIIVAVQAWIFTITNLQATFTARRHLSAAAAGMAASWDRPWVNNLAAVGFPVAIICILVPLAVIANAKQNAIFALIEHATSVLKKASLALRNGQSPDLKALLDLQAQQSTAPTLVRCSQYWMTVLCAVCMAVACIITLLNIYTLFLVVVLRRHVKAGQSRRSLCHQSIAMTQVIETKREGGEEHVMTGTPTRDVEVGQASGTTAPFSTSQQHSRCGAIRQSSGLSQNELALNRLASDLSYAVPLTIFMAVVLTVCVGIIAGKGGNLDSWTLIEFTTDSFAYIYLTLTTVVVSFFLFNLIKAWSYRSEPERPDFVSLTGKKEAVFAIALDPTANMRDKQDGEYTMKDEDKDMKMTA